MYTIWDDFELLCTLNVKMNNVETSLIRILVAVLHSLQVLDSALLEAGHGLTMSSDDTHARQCILCFGHEQEFRFLTQLLVFCYDGRQVYVLQARQGAS